MIKINLPNNAVIDQLEKIKAVSIALIFLVFCALCAFFAPDWIVTTDPSSLAKKAGVTNINSSTLPIEHIGEVVSNPALLKTKNEVTAHDRTYSTENLARIIRYGNFRLLIYDPSSDGFLAYTVGSTLDRNILGGYTDHCGRCRHIIPILIKALLDMSPNRFQPHQPPWQLLFTDWDLPYFLFERNNTLCQQAHPSCLQQHELWPWIHFGSHFRNQSTLSAIQIFPFFNYLACLREWSLDPLIVTSCQVWKLPYVQDTNWTNLISKIVWRGSNFDYLPTIGLEHYDENHAVPHLPFRPRAVLVGLSHNASYSSWLDAEFTSRYTYMSPGDMSHNYRYHIDLGGASGTTWTGTFEKLAMPGVLLHHEAPTQDWYFQELKAYQHYLPLLTNLSNLKDLYLWAENHPNEAEQISHQATNFVQRFFSKERMEQEYQRFFGVKHSVLSNIITAYRHTTNGVLNNSASAAEGILAQYISLHVSNDRIANCTKSHCDIQLKPWLRARVAVSELACVVIQNARPRGRGRDPRMGQPC
jgi:hypothetical protein